MAKVAKNVIESQDKDGMLRRALERIIQLYTDKAHFVYELLQNAEDAGASKIKFEQYADRLVVVHDGCPFSKENLKGLCDIGMSDKAGDLNKIGEFGVGFKSVFGICETVRLYSHPSRADGAAGFQEFAVEIKDFTNPVDIEEQDVEDGYTTMFEFPYRTGLSFSSFQTVDELNDKLSERLQDLGVSTLLFMKHLKSIEYAIDLPKLKTSGIYSLDKESINDHCSLVSARGETSAREEEKKETESEDMTYLVFSRPVKGMQIGRTIDIAYAVSVGENGEYVFKESRMPYISVYFPTETESKLKFIVQGPYRTTPNRSSVPSDDKDNMELARQTAELMRDSAIELRNKKKLGYSFLKILPLNHDAFYSAPLFECMYDKTCEMMQEEKLLKCKNGRYAEADAVKIARSAELTNVFSDKDISDLLNDGTRYHWLPTFLTETSKEYQELYKFLTDELDIEVIRPEKLGTAFNENHDFLSHKSKKWLLRLYNMYDSVGAAFSKQRSDSNMLTAEFIVTSRRTFVAPYRKTNSSDNGYESYLPNVFLPSKETASEKSENKKSDGEKSDNDTADAAMPNANIISGMEDVLYVDEYFLKRCPHFFREVLNLQEPNKYEFFIRDFKKRYESGMEITDDQRVADTKNLLYYRGYNEYRNEINNMIRKHLKLRCTKDGETVYVNPSDIKILFPVNSDEMSIEMYYLNIASHYYVDMDFYNRRNIGVNMLSKLGVTDRLDVGMDVTSGKCDTGSPGPKPKWESCGLFRWNLSLDGLDKVLEYIASHPNSADSMAKSSFIFRFLQKYESNLSGKIKIGERNPRLSSQYSKIVKSLRREGRLTSVAWDGKWLFTKSGELVSQKEISKYDLDSNLYGEMRKNSHLYEILGFAKSNEEKLEEAVKDYDKLDDMTKEQYFEIELKRRYGITPTELDDNYASTSSHGIESSHDTEMTASPQDDADAFPSANIKNWESLRKHVAQSLVYANPVKYEERVRRIRVSRPDAEIKAYLCDMYRGDRTDEFACQMCHEFVPNIESVQLSKDMEKELDAMHLCMCPNCATRYRMMRNDDRALHGFLDRVESLEDSDIEEQNPVEVPMEDERIWFTQTHIAEIKELMKMTASEGGEGD